MPAALLAPGTKIDGRFEIVAAIGRGGFGEVYRAYQATTDRFVALKILTQAAGRRDDARRRFRREARLAARLDHPNIVRVIDFGSGGEGDYIVMDLVEGPALKELIRHAGALPSAAVARLGSRIAAALDHAHQLDLVHRDLKPSNVLLKNVNGVLEPVVIDFGLAKVVGDAGDGSTLTASGMHLGTPAYMSPESVTEGTHDKPGDLYALGAMLFELSTGSPPFSGSTAFETVNQHVHRPVPVGSLREAGVHPALAETIVALMAKNPQQRPQSASEVRESLETLPGVDDPEAHGLDIRHWDALIEVSQTRTLPNDVTPTPIMKGSPTPRGRLGAALASVLVLLIVGALVTSNVGRPQSDEALASEPATSPPSATEETSTSESPTERAGPEAEQEPATVNNQVAAESFVSTGEQSRAAGGSGNVSDSVADDEQAGAGNRDDGAESETDLEPAATPTAVATVRVDVRVDPYGSILIDGTPIASDQQRNYEMSVGMHVFEVREGPGGLGWTERVWVEPGRTAPVVLRSPLTLDELIESP